MSCRLNKPGALVVKKISILSLLAFAGAILALPAHADGIRAHGSSEDMDESSFNDADRTPDHRRDTHIGENFMLNVDRFSTSERDEEADSDSGHSLHNDTAESIWWLNRSDRDKKDKDSDKDPDPAGTPVSAPEPVSLLLLGSGVFALSAWRRRPNRSVPTS